MQAAQSQQQDGQTHKLLTSSEFMFMLIQDFYHVWMQAPQTHRQDGQCRSSSFDNCCPCREEAISFCCSWLFWLCGFLIIICACKHQKQSSKMGRHECHAQVSKKKRSVQPISGQQGVFQGKVQLPIHRWGQI